MLNPLISIIIPVYNAEKTIHRCVVSILNQSFSNFELYLINDGSKDNSLSIIKEYEKKYSNIIAIDKPNEGASLTRNLGLSLAKGDFIVFIDSDDFIDEDYLKHFYEAMTDSQVDIVVGGYKQVDDDKELLRLDLKYPEDSWTPYLVMAPWAKMFRKSFLDEHNLIFMDYTMEDLHFNTVAYSKASKIKVIANTGYNNYINTESVTHTLHQGIRKNIDLLYVFKRIKEDVIPDEFIKFFFKKSYLYYLLFSGKNSSPKEFIEEYNRIIDWIQKEDLSSSLTVFNKKLRSEPLKTRLIIFTFDLINKLGLLPLFAKLYCIGN